MDPKEFAALHAQCWETLKHFVHEADRMCKLFGLCVPEPSSIQIRSDMWTNAFAKTMLTPITPKFAGESLKRFGSATFRQTKTRKE